MISMIILAVNIIISLLLSISSAVIYLYLSPKRRIFHLTQAWKTVCVISKIFHVSMKLLLHANQIRTLKQLNVMKPCYRELKTHLHLLICLCVLHSAVIDMIMFSVSRPYCSSGVRPWSGSVGPCGPPAPAPLSVGTGTENCTAGPGRAASPWRRHEDNLTQTDMLITVTAGCSVT